MINLKEMLVENPVVGAIRNDNDLQKIIISKGANCIYTLWFNYKHKKRDM